ncbi:MAG TPA: tRNA (guanosine(37)-N1)-methyltransferase TrmD [Leucothrix sp.]|nr:tRNA (guanosine(37)-N1)-methyltransferase TrmD [Leucothrix sp.]
MRFDVITLLPELVEAVTKVGVTARAVDRNLIDLHCWNPRNYAQDVHRIVDDRPYGGGPGMVLKAECLLKAIRDAKKMAAKKTKVVYLSPQGKKFDQMVARSASKDEGLILLCGRYEGIDERVVALEVDEEWSLGDYVLSGGELAAMVVIDAVTRLLPSVLGHNESAEQDSFSENLLDYEHYTRPVVVENLGVPAVLRSGDHKAIARWRRKQSIGRTYTRRPDLLTRENNVLSKEDQLLLDEYLKEIES